MKQFFRKRRENVGTSDSPDLLPTFPETTTTTIRAAGSQFDIITNKNVAFYVRKSRASDSPVDPISPSRRPSVAASETKSSASSSSSSTGARALSTSEPVGPDVISPPTTPSALPQTVTSAASSNLVGSATGVYPIQTSTSSSLTRNGRGAQSQKQSNPDMAIRDRDASGVPLAQTASESGRDGGSKDHQDQKIESRDQTQLDIIIDDTKIGESNSHGYKPAAVSSGSESPTSPCQIVITDCNAENKGNEPLLTATNSLQSIDHAGTVSPPPIPSDEDSIQTGLASSQDSPMTRTKSCSDLTKEEGLDNEESRQLHDFPSMDHYSRMAKSNPHVNTPEPEEVPFPPTNGTAITTRAQAPTTATSKASKVNISSFSFSSIARKVKRRSTIVPPPRKSSLSPHQRRPSMPHANIPFYSTPPPPMPVDIVVDLPITPTSPQDTCISGSASPTSPISTRQVKASTSESTLTESDSDCDDFGEFEKPLEMPHNDDTLHGVRNHTKYDNAEESKLAMLLQPNMNTMAEDSDQCWWIEQDGLGQYAANIVYV